MKYSVIPQVHTIIMFGVSIVLWPFLPTVTIMSSMEGMPLYLIQPLFSLELISLLSTATVWVMAMLISLYNHRKQGIPLTKSIVRNSFVASLVLITVSAAISGCILSSEPVPHSGEYTNCLVGLQGIRPLSPFELAYRICYGLGVLFCEATWIILGLHVYISPKLKNFQNICMI